MRMGSSIDQFCVVPEWDAWDARWGAPSSCVPSMNGTHARTYMYRRTCVPFVPLFVPFHSQLSIHVSNGKQPVRARRPLRFQCAGRWAAWSRNQEPKARNQKPGTRHSIAPIHLRTTASQPSAQVSIGTAGTIARQRAVAGLPRAPLPGSARMLDYHGQQLRDQRIRPLADNAGWEQRPLRNPSKNSYLPFKALSARAGAFWAFQASLDQSAPNAR